MCVFEGECVCVYQKLQRVCRLEHCICQCQEWGRQIQAHLLSRLWVWTTLFEYTHIRKYIWSLMGPYLAQSEGGAGWDCCCLLLWVLWVHLSVIYASRSVYVHTSSIKCALFTCGFWEPIFSRLTLWPWVNGMASSWPVKYWNFLTEGFCRL